MLLSLDSCQKGLVYYTLVIQATLISVDVCVTVELGDYTTILGVRLEGLSLLVMIALHATDDISCLI
jgi:hypothetical protein